MSSSRALVPHPWSLESKDEYPWNDHDCC
jgi:hypothetical protein